MASSHIEPLRLTTGELAKRLQDFRREHLREKSADTVGTYTRALREFERWFAGQADTFIFSEDGVRAYKTYLMKTRSLSEASVSTYLTAFRQFCQYLVVIGLMDKNPALAVKGNPRRKSHFRKGSHSRPESHSRAVLTEADIRQLLRVLDDTTLLGKRDQAIVYLMLYGGLSEIEIVRADVRDIEHTLYGTSIRVQGKGRADKKQEARLNPPVIEKIERYLEARDSVLPEHPLFVSHGHRSNGQRLNTRSVRSRISRYLAAADLMERDEKKVTPHSLTYTAPFTWLDKGMDIEEVRERMRHGTRASPWIHLEEHKKNLLQENPEQGKEIVS